MNDAGQPLESSSRELQQSENGMSPASALSSDSVRESAVEQAVKFLGDRRVQAAEPLRAVTFLRGKNLTEVEIREAFRRAELPFPHQEVGRTVPQNVVILPPGAQLSVAHKPQRSSTSWISFIGGITATIGIFALARELLRRYIVPLYFPEISRPTDHRQRSESRESRNRDDQIDVLQKNVALLLESSKEIHSRIDRLSQSLSCIGSAYRGTTSLATGSCLESRTLSSPDPARYSDTLCASETAQTYQGLQSLNSGEERASQIKKDTHGFTPESISSELYMQSDPSQKFYTPRHVLPTSDNENLMRQSSEQSQRRISFDLAKHDMELESQAPSHHKYAGFRANGAKTNTENNADDDDFMSIQPAVVDNSWRLTKRSPPKVNDHIVAPEQQLATEPPTGESVSNRVASDTPDEQHLETLRRFRESIPLDVGNIVSSAAEPLDLLGLKSRDRHSTRSAPAQETALSDPE